MKSAELKQYVRLRPEVTSDQYVCGQVCGEYRDLTIYGNVVMDLGGNIGAFSVYAALRGASKVVTYEPEESNYSLLLENVDAHPVVVPHRGAVVLEDVDEVSFYLTNGAARDGFSTVPFNGRREVRVPAFCFKTEMKKHRPRAIKMDVEGGEFSLLTEEIPDFVKEIVVEIHFSKKKFREEYEGLVSRFSDWNVIRAPKQTGKNFHTLAHWSRP